MSKFALVSTVDTIGDGFPCHCVMVFDTEEAAVNHAVGLIAEYDDSVSLGKGGWSMGDKTWDDPKEFLEAWQEGLDLTEFFHVKPIVPVVGK